MLPSKSKGQASLISSDEKKSPVKEKLMLRSGERMAAPAVARNPWPEKVQVSPGKRFQECVGGKKVIFKASIVPNGKCKMFMKIKSPKSCFHFLLLLCLLNVSLQ